MRAAAHSERKFNAMVFFHWYQQGLTPIHRLPLGLTVAQDGLAACDAVPAGDFCLRSLLSAYGCTHGIGVAFKRVPPDDRRCNAKSPRRSTF